MMTSEVRLVDLPKMKLSSFVKTVLFSIVSISQLVPNHAFSFPRQQPKDNQVT